MICGPLLIALPIILSVALPSPPLRRLEPIKQDPVPGRTVALPEVRGDRPDRTGIVGRLDHMAYDPATRRLFVACVANGSLEAINLDSGKRVGSVRGLRQPQGLAVVGDSVYLATGGDGVLHQFDSRTLAAGPTVVVGDDADNVRAARDGTVWVSFGGEGPGGLACYRGADLHWERRINRSRMPEGFQLHPAGTMIFANVPAGKRSTADGTVVGHRLPSGEPLWECRLTARAANFPMTLDAAHDRMFIATRVPARLVCLDLRDGTILGEAPCPPGSDDLFWDARSGLVAVIGGGSAPDEGGPGGTGAALDLFAVSDQGQPTRVGGLSLPPFSRTGLLVADRRAIYVGVPFGPDRPTAICEFLLPDR